MKKAIVILMLLVGTLVSSTANSTALYAANLTINRIRVANGICYFGVTAPPPGVCSNWTDHFQFSLADNNGKTLFAMISEAKLVGKLIQVWYTSSSAPGTTESNGCTDAAMAIVYGAAYN